MLSVYVYDEGSCEALRIGEVAEELRRITRLQIEVRGEFVEHWIEEEKRASSGLSRTGRKLVERYPDSLAEMLVAARVVDPMQRLQPERTPLPVEISAERRALETPGKTSVGILYDGAILQWLLAELLPAGAEEACHIVITGRLIGTWAPDDRRWHAHTGIYGQPSIISTSGLVQAPARPREYYQGQQLATSRLVPREVVEAQLQQRMADRMLLPNDPRLTSATVGCALQAMAFHRRTEAFCPAPTCRLYNARRQEELLRSQCSDEATLCPEHLALFESLRRGADE